MPDEHGNGFFVAGNRIQQRTCDGSPQQLWFKVPVGTTVFGTTTYHFVNRMTLQCLDDMGGATNDRNPVQQWPCNTSTTMAWEPFNQANPLGAELINQRATHSCLDVSDGSLRDGARLQIYHCFDEQENIAQHYTMR